MAESRGVTVRWPEQLRKKIEARAERDCRSFGQEAVYLVTRGLELVEYEQTLINGSVAGMIHNRQDEAAG
jgi:hypothetical protein